MQTAFETNGVLNSIAVAKRSSDGAKITAHHKQGSSK
ncbi:hypothetical protein ABIE49_003413 [Bradyrhizobium sp. OAE829]